MATDTELVREAVRDEAVKHGIHDPEMIGVFDLSKVGVEDGKAKPADVETLVQSMRRKKPALFRITDARKLSDENFKELENHLRSQRSTRPDPPRYDNLERISMASLSIAELTSLAAVKAGSGSSDDRLVVEEAAARQNITLRLGSAA